MEAMLKYLLAFGKIGCPVSDIGTQMAERVDSFSKIPLGRLMERAAGNLYGNSSAANLPPGAESETRLSVAFSLEGGKDEARMWRTTMMSVVQERNVLIHQMLARFDPRSMQSCERLCSELDAQRERIFPAYSHLESLVLAVRDAYKDLKSEIDEQFNRGLDERSRDCN
jgi:hypothetical protein